MEHGKPNFPKRSTSFGRTSDSKPEDKFTLLVENISASIVQKTVSVIFNENSEINQMQFLIPEVEFHY